MAISKKIRFEVFKRDGFMCAYCGRTPPTVTLEVDHVDPKSKGGKDDINNLITACFDCNRGKTNTPLDRVPSKLSENLEVLKEQELQIKEYRKYVKKIEKRVNKDIESVAQMYAENYDGWVLSDDFKRRKLKIFITTLPLNEVKWAMEESIYRFPNDKDVVIRYFCGICWKSIKSYGKNEQTVGCTI